MSHEVFNMTAPLVETRMANLLKVSYNMRVKPRTNELYDLDKASISTSILQYKQKTLDFGSNVTNAIALVGNNRVVLLFVMVGFASG